MPAVLDDEPQRFVESGPAVVEKARSFRERAKNIDNRNRHRGLLDRGEFAQSLVAQFLKKLILDLTRPFVRAENFSFHLFELRRDETFATDGRLFSRVMRRHARKIRFRYFDEITEDRVVAHLERFDGRRSDLALLQLADPVLAIARSLMQFVKIDIVTVAKNSAFFQRQRRIIDERFPQLLGQRRHFLDLILQTLL